MFLNILEIIWMPYMIFLTEQPDILQMKFLHYNMMQSQLGRSFCQQLLKVLQDADILTIIDEH